MQEISYKTLREVLNEDWVRLSNEEKAFCMSYQRFHARDLDIPAAAILKMNELYDKYPDINILACIPPKVR